MRSAYRILAGTTRNCAGGATPWDRWLSCEETSRGYVHETDPDGTRLYFSSQRGTTGSSSGGTTYEVTGPFRR